MMRVLVIETTVFGYDGISNVVVNYYKYQNHEKVWMDLLTINPVNDTLKKLLNQNNNQNFVLPCRNRNPFKYVRQLVKIIREGEYDIIHVHGCSATMAVEMLAGKLAGVDVRIAHSHNTKCNHMWINRFLRIFFKRWCNYGFACGEEAGKWLFPKKEFFVIPNGIDLQKFRYDEAMRNLFRKKNNLDGKFVVGHIGRFSMAKNHEKLVDIFAKISKRVPNSILVLIGDGELREQIENKVKTLNLNVLFVGLSSQVEKWLQAMDVMVFPSIFEGLPLSLVEAQATALPCMLSDSISPMTKITDPVRFESLDATAETWADDTISLVKSFDRNKYSSEVKDMIRKAHYDIRENCAELVSQYERMVSESK